MYPYLSDSNTIDENLKVIQEQEGLSNIDDVKEILLYNNIDISKFKEEEPINEVNLLIEKVIKLWEEKFIKDSSGIEKDIIDLFLEELKSCMKIQKLKEKIEDQLSPKFNRVKIDREDEIYFASVTTSTFNKFINDFGISNLTESTLNKIENILTAREKILFNKIRSYNKTSIDDITQIFNKDIEDDSETYSIFLENFEKWKLNMKSSFLNNCGYIDNEKNNQAVKKIITSMTKIEI